MKYITRRNVGLPTTSLFDSMLRDWSRVSTRFPAVDITEGEKAYILEAELPGYKQEEVKVQVEKHVLTISSTKESSVEESEKALINERCYQCFERSFTLPEDVDEDKIEGEFMNGLLILTLPKKEVVKPKAIEVKIK
ncbi:MAG TPA: Hsp20/alpha crystallin family protein [Sphaerochaeta sp.]|nr:Hsp20/alpha crystallin family protein [Sphaerochaeta sp.]